MSGHRHPPARSDLDTVMWALQAYDSLALATTGSAGPHVAAEFFAPDRTDDGFRLVLAIVQNCRNHRDILEDDRVAFMCSPGNASRWVQGAGRAVPVSEAGASERMFTHLARHAPGAQTFLDAGSVVAVRLTVHSVKVVGHAEHSPLILTLV